MSYRNYYDTSSYGRREPSRPSTAAEKPTTVTAKYLSTTPSYKSSSIPILERPTKDDSPISSIASRYSSYKVDKPSSKFEKKDYSLDKSTSKYDKKDYSEKSSTSSSKFEKKDYNKLTVPSLSTSRSKDVSPVSTSSKYSNLSRTSRHLSPDTRSTKSYKDSSREPSPNQKDIPNKTEKSTVVYNGLSSYKLYPRVSNYTRTPTRETKPEVSVNRYAIANRLSSNYLRSPPTVKRASVSPVHINSNHKEIKNGNKKSVSPVAVVEPMNHSQKDNEEKVNDKEIDNCDINDTETISVITRHTSPTPPGSSAYVRNRRADMAKTVEKTITRSKKKPEMIDKDVQSDRLDDPTRTCRFASTVRPSVSNWNYYTPNITSYTGYAGRYSTQYSGLGERSGNYSDRSSRSHSAEPSPSKENSNNNSSSAPNYSETEKNHSETNKEIIAVYEESKDDDTSEIIINVNLKLKRAKSPLTIASAELVSPEITITNSQLPPQPPKTESTVKIKKIKVRKSTDSLSDSSSKKKVVKKRSKSISSNDSDRRNETNEKSKSVSPPKSKTNSSSSKNYSRENNSPESVSTLSTPSSISEDDTASKSKTNDISRTSADEVSIPTDQSNRQCSSAAQKTETDTEEAKSFLIKALTPVANLFKRQQDSIEIRHRADASNSDATEKDVSSLTTNSEKSPKTNNSSNNIVEVNDNNLTNLKSIRHIESGERAWWLDENVDSEKQNNSKSHESRSLSETNGLRKIRHIESGERAWWLDENVDSEKQNNSKSHESRSLSETNGLRKIRHIESGERAWWLDENGDSEKQNNSKSHESRSLSETNGLRKIRHIESGERAWWIETSGEQKCENMTPQTTTESSESSRSFHKNKLSEDEKPWWQDSGADIPEGIEQLSPPRKTSSESEKSEKYNFFKVRHINSGDVKDWWLSSNDNSSNSNKNENNTNLSKSDSDQKSFPVRRIRHIESGERPWWLSSDKSIPSGVEKLPTPPPPQESDSSDSEEVEVYVPPNVIPPFPIHHPDDEPLGARRSPEGLETPKENEDFRGRASPYENNNQFRRRSTNNIPYSKPEKYISRFTDIDDILGTSGQMYSPFMDSILARRTGFNYDDDECKEIDPTQVRIHDSTAQRPVIKKVRGRGEVSSYRDEDELDDVTLQVFKDGEYGPYLDLDSTLGEQEEELEGIQDNRKNALVLRTQLSVRVHAIIERLLHSQGRELRRALFTLKQILQSDKDLVHEFVANKGLDCLIQVSSMADHNFLDYVLRALGQILLYVDGMHGVMTHKRCVQWLYSLISSKFRHIVKTALKLLLVFVEYTESNCLLLLDAIHVVDTSNGRPPWYNIMKILQDFDASDVELLIYATTLINRCLNNIPDRDTYYDQVDALQDQGIDDIVQLYMMKQGTDLDLLRQLQIFEAVLMYEDGDESGTALNLLDDSIIKSLRRRNMDSNSCERRKSKKQQMKEKGKAQIISHLDHDTKTTTTHRTQFLPTIVDNKENKELKLALRKRRDRFARHARHIIQQQEMLSNPNTLCNGSLNSNGNHLNGHNVSLNTNGSYLSTIENYSSANGNLEYYTNGNNKDEDLVKTSKSTMLDVIKNGNQRYTSGLKQRIQNGTLGHSVNVVDAITVMRQKQIDSPEVKDDREILLNREHTIKDLAQRLTSPLSPTTEEKPRRVAEMAGIVSKAKEELAKSQSKEVIKSPTIEITPKVPEKKVSENDLHWEELKKGCLNRQFHLCDLDFSDLQQDSDDDVGLPAANASGIPPPPPPGMLPPLGAPPPIPGSIPPFLKNCVPAPPPKPPLSSEISKSSNSCTIKKNKKTVKLFWREIQENPVPAPLRSKIGGFIWDDLPDISLDTNMLEHLFESKTNDLIIKKLMEAKRNLILDAKRSNAINIAMKKLPNPQIIRAAIMKMDATVISREGIEKLLTMLPTEDEKVKIQEAQFANPDLPLGSAEQFLLALASINELPSRLKLWVFKLDFDNLEKEIAEPLMDLKQGIELLKVNKTFKVILSTLRSVGSFLNGSEVKGFRLEYLSKVMEVKDTIHKHPLLHHICEMIIEKFRDSSDLFSEVGPVIRASKVDFDMLSANLARLEIDCKASWDHMKRVAKHDGTQIFKTKINEFLTDAAERIILLSLIEKRVMNRYMKFLLYLGVPPSDLPKTKPSEFLKVIAEFALEYRTTRERVLQQLEKKAKHRERNKTRGKMIIDVGNYSAKNGDHSADMALKELLTTDPETDSLAERRRRHESNSNSNSRRSVVTEMSADEEIIESLVRSATSKRKSIPRERRRNRAVEKKNFNRTLDRAQTD